MSFVKLDTNLLRSSLWINGSSGEKVTWLTLLMLANPDGTVQCTAPGIARVAGVSRPSVRKALKRFEEPDEDSRTMDHDGRRIKRVDGGYLILNYEKYRDKDHGAKERMRRYRARKKVTA